MVLGFLAFWYADGGRLTATEIGVLSPVATFAAVGVALWVATSDRRLRMKERDAEDEAQAKLVIVLPRRPSNPLELQIQVTNHGTRAIVDLTFVDWLWTATISTTCSPPRGRSR